ncbi:ComF family protein [Telmatospirillum sp. J64-1]|uniref:ComF family protein n=1 Tax=Telmatospirillum sp. J64-1 TaxID=2502183 RepID=UPI00115D5298|nr:ComF family protein [Telmatospirillum sp. J64-1]
MAWGGGEGESGWIRLGGLGRRILDMVLPPQCLACNAIVDQPGALCPACWSKVHFLAPPFCACCGQPFDLDPGPGALCGACLAAPPPFGRARAAFRYDDHSKALVLRFKHGDRTDAAPAYARWMVRAGADILAEADLLVPVPLHRWRLFARRYNQAALLALAVGRLTGVAVAPDALRRLRRTPSQGRLSRQGRARNVKGAFAVTPAQAAKVEGKRVVLVDDVLTSGATLGECAGTLLRAGAASVDALTLARVLREGG